VREFVLRFRESSQAARRFRAAFSCCEMDDASLRELLSRPLVQLPPPLPFPTLLWSAKDSSVFLCFGDLVAESLR